jgi:hypothetical protein
MWFPFASHFCFTEVQSLTEERFRSHLETELVLEYPDTNRVVEVERELPELELGPDLIPYEPGQLEYLDSLSPEVTLRGRISRCRQDRAESCDVCQSYCQYMEETDEDHHPS